MNTEQLSFGQRRDSENNLIECWFTHGALDWIKQQDWSDKVVWMFGAGLGDLWLAKRCKELHVVERDWAWINKCHEQKNINDIHNLTYYHRPCNDSSGMDEMYCDIPIDVDVIINDDAYRTEVVKMAINYFKNKKGGGILICDNYNQSYIWRSPSALEALEPFEKLIFEQPNHEDYNKELEPDGKWKTAVIFIK